MATCIENFVKTLVTGDGVTTQYVIDSAASPHAENYRVDIDGVLQEPDTDYGIDNGKIVFTTAPPDGAKVVIIADSTDGTIFYENEPLQNISPNAPDITTILKTECIGNSLATINNNFQNLRQAICTIDNFLAAASVKLNVVSGTVNNITSQPLPQAFVSFDGTRDVDGTYETPLTLTNSERFLNNSYNIDNVKRDSVGQYTVSFPTTAFATNKYVINGNARDPGIVTYDILTEASVRIFVKDFQGTLVDSDLVGLTFFIK